MAAPYEILVTSEASGQLWNACVWDPASGTSLLTYKGASSGPRTLCTLADEYLLGAVNNKPLIHVWQLHRKEQQQTRIVCSGKVTAMATSPDGLYCVAAIGDKIHVWQVGTGHLLVVLARHYQPVNCIRFTDDGSHFISAGEDNLVLVWSLASVLSGNDSQFGPAVVEPRYVWSAHSLPVTDIYVGCGGSLARVVTASLDQTCRVWELASGTLLCTFIFDAAIMSVALDNVESRLFAGAQNGHISQANLFDTPVMVEKHINTEEDGSQVFTGHSKQVSCLSVSMDGTMLASGSHDASVKLWHILSRQCVRTLPHKDITLTNLEHEMMGNLKDCQVEVADSPNTPLPTLQKHYKPDNGISNYLLDGNSRPTLPLAQFQRHLYQAQDSRGSDQPQQNTVSIRIRKQQDEYAEEVPLDKELSPYLEMPKSQEVNLEKKSSEKTVAQLKQELGNLSEINKTIYEFAVQEILSGKIKNT